LLSAYSLGQHRITNRIVKRAISELDGKSSRHRQGPVGWQKLVIGLLVFILIIVSGLFFSQTSSKRSSEPSVRLDANKASDTDNKIERPALPSRFNIPAETVKETPLDDAKPKPLTVSPSPAADPLPALAPLPSTSAIEIVPAPKPPFRNIEHVLKAQDALTSRRGALTAVLAAWHAPTSPLTGEPMDGIDSDTFFRIFARRSDMESLRIQGNLTRIKRLNLPAILEFSLPDGGGLRYLAVVRLAGDEIRLSDGEDTFSTNLGSLSGHWKGVAYILWKNYYNYMGIIPISSPGEAVISLKIHLKALGFPIEEVSAAYNIATRKAIEAVQARNGLIVDGVVGPLTKIALYNEDQSLNIPRLANTPSGQSRS
jgi:general secretion pathway protein A